MTYQNDRAAFSAALERYVQFPDDPEDVQKLHRLCGRLWNDAAGMPMDDRHNVRDAIENWVAADDWESKGFTYSGAARRIRPNLKIA